MQTKRTRFDRLSTRAIDRVIHEIGEIAWRRSRYDDDKLFAAQLREVVQHLLRPVREQVLQMEAAGLTVKLCVACGRDAKHGLTDSRPHCGKAKCIEVAHRGSIFREVNCEEPDDG